jgi:hypothetical protein
MAQLALYETEIVDMPQVFLPFATEAKGQTLYRRWSRGSFCSGLGQKNIKPADSAWGAYLPVWEGSRERAEKCRNPDLMERQTRASQEPSRESTSQAGKSIKVTK